MECHYEADRRTVSQAVLPKMQSKVFFHRKKSHGHEVKSYTHSLPISCPGSAILQIFSLALTLLLASISKLTQQGLWRHCTSQKILCHVRSLKIQTRCHLIIMLWKKLKVTWNSRWSLDIFSIEVLYNGFTFLCWLHPIGRIKCL